MAFIDGVVWFVAVTYFPVVACWWYFSLYYLRRLKRAAIRLAAVGGWPADRPAPSLAVIIPCHNEAAGIEACVRKLLRQSYPNFRIVIANDRSTDRTCEIVHQLAAEDGRVAMVQIRELPAGWIGKTHAVAQAVRRCDSDYLLFLDSDVELAPHALSAVMHKVSSEDTDFLSFWPHLDLRSFAERLLAPPALLLLAVAALPRARRGDLTGTTQFGNGQFMLFKRAAYAAIGGHAAVADELAEDAVLAARAHAAGQRCWFGLGAEQYVAYRDGGFSRTVHALARMLIGSLQRPKRLWFGQHLLFGGGFAPVWIIPLAAACLGLGANAVASLVLLVLGILHWVGMTLTLRALFRLTLVRRGPLIWFPFGSLLVTGILVWCSYLLSGRGTLRWGATRYRVSGSRVVAALEEED